MNTITALVVAHSLMKGRNFAIFTESPARSQWALQCSEMFWDLVAFELIDKADRHVFLRACGMSNEDIEAL